MIDFLYFFLISIWFKKSKLSEDTSALLTEFQIEDLCYSILSSTDNDTKIKDCYPVIPEESDGLQSLNKI